MDLTVLNFPAIAPRLRTHEGKPQIFDILRKKFVMLAPEEWVRQHVIHFLIQKGYPASLMSVERGLRVNRLQKRTDVVIYDRDGRAFLLVECKAPEIQISENVLRQATIYNQTIQARHIMLTNGLAHYCLSQDPVTHAFHFVNHLPDFG